MVKLLIKSTTSWPGTSLKFISSSGVCNLSKLLITNSNNNWFKLSVCKPSESSITSKYKGNFTNDSFSYQFVSARVSINNLDTRKFVKDYIYKSEEIYESPSKAVDFYAYGLALIKEKKYEKSIFVLKHLLNFLNTKEQLYIIKNYISVALSEAYLQNNNKATIKNTGKLASIKLFNNFSTFTISIW